jgi:hypothetical protein
LLRAIALDEANP